MHECSGRNMHYNLFYNTVSSHQALEVFKVVDYFQMVTKNSECRHWLLLVFRNYLALCTVFLLHKVKYSINNKPHDQENTSIIGCGGTLT